MFAIHNKCVIEANERQEPGLCCVVFLCFVFTFSVQ